MYGHAKKLTLISANRTREANHLSTLTSNTYNR